MAEWIQSVGKISVPTPLPIGNVNMFLLKGDALTLVDAGIKTQEAWEVFKQELSELGYSPNDIEQVILTHHHTDHVGLLEQFSNVKIYGHEYGRKWLKKEPALWEEIVAFFTKIYKQFGIPSKYYEGFKDFRLLDKLACENQELFGTLSEGMTIPGHPNWVIYETPGHSQSQLSYYNEREGLLIGGDHILASMFSNPVIEPPYNPGKERPKPILDYLRSLEKIKQIPVDVVFPGHGPEVKQVYSLIERRVSRFHDSAMKVKTDLLNKQMTAFELNKLIFPKAYGKNMPMTISQTVGFLDYLISIEEIRLLNEQETHYFIANN
ncbi:MBL fold metallo-hydrolase [Pallidibacillus pasinlerensis]|uniref:MBL fold metallo-hydrolase n=1 Tax=Pallidibacillus pasinlerensis TaxID=2703818 RepID=A0ABX0A6E9_9BACI|nr:MBL fold metallo-hydrolase [Pallidibacillus pasinlerensis]NCU16747.1 MBL fold metallo-hydrolase [Pallidibacillus pasinlerensis]